jgi:hypothetical protein
MKTEHKNWTIRELVEQISKIEFPEFQREPTVWGLEKKQLLIDSILREFDIASFYFYKKERDAFDCIDGRQRINAILSYLGINGDDEDHNAFNLKIENEIYDDKGRFDDVNTKRFERLDKLWKDKIYDYKLNIVFISEIETEDEEQLNLLFLRLQIASVLNAGEKLHAMKGEIRDFIFHDICNHQFFKKIKIPDRRFAKEQIAAQIVLNAFSQRDYGTFHRTRYLDLQDFFKQYNKLTTVDKILIKKIKSNLDTISHQFGDKLRLLANRAIAVSIYNFISQLIEQNKDNEISEFVKFFITFLKTLKWQLPKGVAMNKEYYDLLKFQTSISQAAGEKSAIEKRHDFLGDYFYYFKNEKLIKGDKEYKKATGKDPDTER